MLEKFTVDGIEFKASEHTAFCDRYEGYVGKFAIDIDNVGHETGVKEVEIHNKNMEYDRDGEIYARFPVNADWMGAAKRAIEVFNLVSADVKDA